MHVPLTISRSEAHERLSRRGMLGRLLPAPRQAYAHLPKLSCIYLPHWLLELTLTAPGPNNTGRLMATVDAHAGACALCTFAEDPHEGLPPEAHFAPFLELEECARLAERDTSMRVLAQRGQRRRPFVENVQCIGLLHWPYWIYYYERLTGRIDFRMLDAATGEKPGHKLKTAALNALLRAEQTTS